MTSGANGSGWEYAPAPETTEVRIEPRYGLFVGGRFVASKGRRRMSTLNPANERELASVVQSNAADVDAAVAAARKAFRKWSR
ncbi:MAG: aldehyde dehydrogenase family protein, partial [Planctomycetota bacterium]|nr:aldehyde dehydrogenase family protein [Planctomycetota bacterium]